MKCLTQLYASFDPPQSPIFLESFVNPKHHKHCVIECIPVPSDLADDAPAYFKDALLNADEEWSTHRKIIDTSKGGIRRTMVKNLPFFHVWFDPNRGYGHVIEDSSAWKEWFGKEVLAGMMDLPPDLWRRPRWADKRDEKGRLDKFRQGWSNFDWTKALD